MSNQEFVCPLFSGFYNSIFTPDFNAWDLFNDADNVDKDIVDYCVENAEVPQEYYNEVAKTYLERMGNYIVEAVPSIKMEYKELESPKYYNYETDKIMGTCNYNEIKEDIKSVLNKYPNIFDFVVKKHFTSYSGFISFYSNNYREWDFDNLDHNQLMAVMEVLTIVGFMHVNYAEVVDEITESDIYSIESTIEFDVFEYISGNVYAEYKIDFDALKDEFNLPVSVSSFDELEQFEKVGSEYVVRSLSSI